MIASTTEFTTFADGVARLERRWATTSQPRAALLLVHGIGEHSGRYEHVGSALAEAGIDVLSYDQRGFGQSGGQRAYVDSFDDFLDDITPLLADRQTHDAPVVLMGHSLGGLVATSYLVSRRPQPDLAVLSAPALGADMPTWQRMAAPILGTVAPKFSIAADFDGSILTRDDAVGKAYEDDPLRVAASSARLGREILRAMRSTSDRLDRISMPTYVLHGGADTLVPPSASAPLADLAQVTRRVWPTLRHECMNEPERDEVIAEIIAWLDSQL